VGVVVLHRHDSIQFQWCFLFLLEDLGMGVNAVLVSVSGIYSKDEMNSALGTVETQKTPRIRFHSPKIVSIGTDRAPLICLLRPKPRPLRC
jgi:hypothetical protein